jgi:hypothetical protein
LDSSPASDVSLDAYPLLLHLMGQDLGGGQWLEIAKSLESYLLRRAVCGMTSKNYNRVFLTLTRQLQGEDAPADVVGRYLSELKGESTEWPSDQAFRTAWATRDAYRTLQNQKLVYILKRLNDAYLSPKAERISIEGPLSVEHILPQNWVENWPLPDGSKGMTEDQLQESQASDARAEATHRRNSLLQTMGNLTILTQELNSAVSNSGWPTKKPVLLAASLLPINQKLQAVEHWDEAAIVTRSEELFAIAVNAWPGPQGRT